MSDFNLVYSEFWPEARARGWDDDMDKLALYILTCEHRTMAGLFRLPLPYAAADLGWPLERVSNGFTHLIREGFLDYDGQAQVVLIRSAVKRHAPKSEKHIQGAVSGLSKLPKSALLLDLLESAETHAEGFAYAIRKAFAWVNDSGTAVEFQQPETHSNLARVRADLRQQTTDHRQETSNNEGSSLSSLRHPSGASNVVEIERATTSEPAA